MHVLLPSPVEARLRDQARRQGLDAESYASKLIEEAVVGPHLDDLLAPLAARFLATGISDDDLGDLLELEKHAARDSRPPAARP